MNVVKIRDGRVENLFALDQDGAKDLVQCLNTIDLIDTTTFLLPDVFFTSADIFLSYSQKTIDEAIQLGPDFLVSFGGYQRNSSRHLMAVLTSFFSLIEVTPQLIERDLKDTKTSRAFEKKVSSLESNVFEFRFIRKFRNYVQHNNFPVRNLDLNFLVRNRNEISGIVLIDRDELLAHGRWKNKDDPFDVGAELRTMPSEIILEPIVRRLRECVTELVQMTIDMMVENRARELIPLVRLYNDAVNLGNEEQIGLLLVDVAKSSADIRYFNIELIARLKKMFDFDNAVVE